MSLETEFYLIYLNFKKSKHDTDIYSLKLAKLEAPDDEKIVSVRN